ncbi:MAG: OmpA family protein [Flavobacteriaceae bacterium]
MRVLLFLFGLLFYQVISAQGVAENSRILEWADYYFMNQSYDRALSHYLSLGDELPLKSRRNYSKVYAQKGNLKKAAQILRPLVDSDSAVVKDYYYFASYLTDNKKLREEYRRKAIRLPIEEDWKQANRPLDSTYTLIPLPLNTEGPEFGVHLMNKEGEKWLVYTQLQSKKYTQGLSRKIDSKHSIFNLYRAQWDAESFSVKAPESFPLGVNSVFQDGPSGWDPKEQILYLTRSADPIKKQKTIQLDIYAWSEMSPKMVRPLPFNVDGYASLHPAVSTKDRRLYFASDRPGGFGGMDLYYVDILSGSGYGPVVNLGPDINTADDEVFPSINQGKYLFFSRKSKNGRLSPKLALNRVDVRWHVMALPAPFDSDQDDFSFSVEEQLDYGFLSSNRENGKGDDDLYLFKFSPDVEGLEDEYTFNPIDTLIVSQEGVLKNDEALMLSQDPLTALFPKEAVLVENVRHGTLKFNSNGSFLYKNSAPLQVRDSFSYSIDSKYGKSETIKVILQRSEVALEQLSDTLKKTFLPIYYDYNRSNLLVDYKDRVEAVVSALTVQPNMIVEVSSFSDCRGNKDFNLRLSEQRNQTIINYVRERIDNPDRIFGKGYGENTVMGNTTMDYLIIGGAFSLRQNAMSNQKLFDDLGYAPEIQKTKEGIYQVVVNQAATYYEAENIFQTLKAEGFKVWIKKCNCCTLAEEEHLLNRRTDFKIIRY